MVIEEDDVSSTGMTRTPSVNPTIEPLGVNRLFIDMSTVAALQGHPPHKFTRLVEALTRDVPGAIAGTMTSRGFLRQDIVSFDTTPSYKRLFFEGSDVEAKPYKSKTSWWQRAQLHTIAALSRVGLPQTTQSYLRDLGAYKLARSYQSMPNCDRLRFHRAFDIDAPDRESKFAWWLKDDVEKASLRSFFRGDSQSMDVNEQDVVVFCGLVGGMRTPTVLGDPGSTRRFKAVCILLDVSPLLSPGIASRVQVHDAKETIQGLASAADLFIVSSRGAAEGVREVLAASGTRCPEISIMNMFFGLSPHGPQFSVSMRAQGRFALTIMTSKRRKNGYWLLSAWQAAAAICGDALPHLVIVSSADDEHGWSLNEEEAIFRRATILKRPADQELRWLFANAAFVIQPPAQGGLGLAAVEALFFHKKVLCERHPANAYLDENELAHRLDLDLDLWVSAIVEACTMPSVDGQLSYETHARHTRQFADDMARCLESVRGTAARQ